MTYVIRAAGLALVAAVLAACGGGGGGGSNGGGAGGGSTTPPPGGGGSPPPIDLQAIKLMPQGYQETVGASGSLLGLAISIGQVAASAFEVRDSTASSAPYVESCDDSGQMSIDHVDNDGNRQVSSGDRLVMRYSNCVGGNTTSNGVINIDIAGLAVEAGRRTVDLRVSIESFVAQSDVHTIRYAGGVDNHWVATQSSDHFVISGTRLEISGIHLPDRLENFSIDLEQDYTNYEYRLSWRGDVESEALGGTFRFDTDTELLGQLGGFPRAGAWTIYGDDSAVRLEEGAYGESLGAEVGLVGDFDGDGVFEPSRTTLPWGYGFYVGMFDGFRPIAVPDQLPDFNLVRGREVLISAWPSDLADIVVDPGRDVLYTSVPFSNEVVAVSTSTYHVVDRIPVGSMPKGLYLPTGSSELMVALSRGGAVARLNPETRNIQRMETAVANNASAPEVVLGSGDAVYVTSFPSRTNQDVLPSYLARGSRATNVVERLPAFLPEARAPMELTVDGRYVFTIERAGIDTRLVKRDLTLPDAPVVASRTFTHLTTEKFKVNPDGQTLVFASGEVLRTSDFAQIARVDGYDALGFNEDGSRMLATFGGSLVLYDAQRYITLRTLWPADCAQSASQSKQVVYVAAHDQWVIKYDNKICAVSIVDRLNAPGQEGSAAPPTPLQPVPLTATSQNVFTPLDQGGITVSSAEIDRQRGVLYLGGRRNMVGEVAVVSLADLSTIATIPLPSIREPLSLALNDARDRLYVNQWGDGDRLEVVDTSTDSLVAPLAYPADLFGVGHGLTDAKWIGNDRLLMTPNSGGALGTMATLDTQTGTGARIAGGEARFPPGRLIISADRASAFTSGYLAPVGPALQRIDLTQPAPVVAMTRVNQELGGGAFATFSPDGNLLYFSSGIVVNPQTLMVAGFTGEGLQIPTPDGSTVYALDTLRQTLSVFDARTYQLRALYSIEGCFGQAVFAQLGLNSRDIIWTAGAGVCRVTVP